MIYLIYLGENIWNICETYVELIKEVKTLKYFHRKLLNDNQMKIYSYKKNADITNQVKEMINS